MRSAGHVLEGVCAGPLRFRLSKQHVLEGACAGHALDIAVSVEQTRCARNVLELCLKCARNVLEMC